MKKSDDKYASDINEFVEFEKKNGSISILKAAISNIHKILIESGVANEKEIIEGMKKELKLWDKEGKKSKEK